MNDEELAVETLRAICRDGEASASARAAAARAILELNGRLGKHSAPLDEDRAVEEMSAADLAAELQRIRSARRSTKG